MSDHTMPGRLATEAKTATGTAPLTLTGRIIEVGNLDGGNVPGFVIDRGNLTYATITGLTEDEARTVAWHYDKPIIISVAPPVETAPSGQTPQVDALMAKWGDDGAARGAAFCELRDLAREMEVMLGELQDENTTLAKQVAQGPGAAQRPELTVWYGPMPESNGKSNFTAILMRKDGEKWDNFTDGITIDRSEYPDRVRYEADRVRYLIGELVERPFILDYDDKKHSSYVAPHKEAAASVQQDAPVDDPIVEANRKLLLERSRVGINKYGVTLAASGLSRAQLAQHALEEALDLANYLQTIIQTDAAMSASPAEEKRRDE